MSSPIRISFLLAVGVVVAAPGLGNRGLAQQAIDLSLELPTQEDPAVEAILATQPDNPVKWVQAAKILADLDRPDLARGFLKQVIDAALGALELVDLEQRFGAATFTTMASRADLAPEAQLLADAVLEAGAQHAADPDRIAAMIGKLEDPVPAVRLAASMELCRARGAAVGPLLALLADPGHQDEYPIAWATIVAMKSDALGPLVAALDAPEPKVTAEAVRVLGSLEAAKAGPFLLVPYVSPKSSEELRQTAEAALATRFGRVPSRPAALRFLVEEAQRYFDREQPFRDDIDGQSALWTWDPAAGQPVEKWVPARAASLHRASQLAGAAHAAVPEDRTIRLLYLAARLEQAAYEAGLDQPLDSGKGTPAGEVAALEPGEVENLLAYALEREHPAAAAAAARVLGKLGRTSRLLNQGIGSAPLVQAAWNNDRRVRFAAVEAIVRLAPDRPFPGSSRVTQAWGSLVASGGPPRAMVASVTRAEANRVGGYLVALGYDLATAVTGREAMRELLHSGDFELVLLDGDLPGLPFLLQQFRHDCRTARLPVGLLASSGRLSRARHLARTDPLAEAFSRPHTQESVAWQVKQLVDLSGPEHVAQEERERQATAALEWLVAWTDRKQSVFDVSGMEEAVAASLYRPNRAVDAVTVLGNLRTATSQETLVDAASRWTLPIEVRQAAAKAFHKSVQRSGILLTSVQMIRQYDRYNASETLDVPTQKVLGAILDSIEAPTRVDAPQPVEAAGREEAAAGTRKNAT